MSAPRRSLSQTSVSSTPTNSPSMRNARAELAVDPFQVKSRTPNCSPLAATTGDGGSAFLPNLSRTPVKATANAGEPPSSRPGSSSRKHSMTRLPDEAPGLRKAGGAASGGLASPLLTSSGVRPNSASQRQAGMIRLPDEPGTPGAASSGGNPWISEVVTSTSARPGSGGTQARKASLSRLPDDNPAPVIVLSSPQATSRPGSAEQQGAPKTNANAPSKSKLRDRLNKSLTVTTSLKQGERQGQTKPVQAFRQLTEGENINDIYDFGEEIYSGGAKGKVIVAKKRSDNTEVVVKIRTKHSNRSSERTWRAIMSSLHGMGGSQHVLDIIEIVEGPSAFYVVMPKCNGGELFEFLATETEVPESECKRIIREILIAVGHLHKHNLVHRDIKPENIMFDVDLAQASPKTVKLIDFDTCLEWTPATPKSRRFVGTPGYIAPEALLGQISPQSDLWSVGVILYILMTGEMPWSSLVSLEDGVVGSPGATQMYNALKGEVLEWEQEPWPDFPLARDLCQKLLAFKVEERLSTVKDALGHPWLRSD